MATRITISTGCVLDELRDAFQVQGLRATRLKTSVNARYSVSTGWWHKGVATTQNSEESSSYVLWINQLIILACSISGLLQGLEAQMNKAVRKTRTLRPNRPHRRTFCSNVTIFSKTHRICPHPSTWRPALISEGLWQDIWNPLAFGCFYSTFTGLWFWSSL